ncbi:hypothetical protein GO289_05087 [Ralstonia solanacearum]|nr:hypothetical protein [Ralstonia solanacearum]
MLGRRCSSQLFMAAFCAVDAPAVVSPPIACAIAPPAIAPIATVAASMALFVPDVPA